MSISSEITRITNKRDASFTKVASKGVTVPSGSTMDDLPDLIDLIVVDPTYSVSKTLTNVTSSNDDTKVIAGGSYYADLTPTSGYAITSITVTIGGVDVTEQVFKPGTGAKAITANGTYNASADSLSGYDRVVVNVPPTQPDLGTKTITVNGTYTASDDSLDGYSEVAVNVPTGSTPTGTKSISISANGTTTEDVANYASAEITVNVPNSYTAADEGKVVFNGALVAQTSDTVTQNGTVDTTLISSLTVNVSAGSGYTKYKTGTYTPPQTYNSSGSREITTIANIGFTPTKFIMSPTNISDISGTQYAIVGSTYEALGNPEHYIRQYMRYQNTSNSLGFAGNTTSWINRNDGHFYLSDGTIYFRTASNCILKGNVEYTWYAYE